MSETEETSMRLDRRQKSLDATFYYDLVMRQYEEGSPLLLDPDYLAGLGPEKTTVLCHVLQDEYTSAYNGALAGYGSFSVFPSQIAEQTGLSVRKVTRILERLSDLPPNIRSRRRYGYIQVIDRGPEAWKVAINDDRLWPDL